MCILYTDPNVLPLFASVTTITQSKLAKRAVPTWQSQGWREKHFNTDIKRKKRGEECCKKRSKLKRGKLLQKLVCKVRIYVHVPPKCWNARFIHKGKYSLPDGRVRCFVQVCMTISSSCDKQWSTRAHTLQWQQWAQHISHHMHNTPTTGMEY